MQRIVQAIAIVVTIGCGRGWSAELPNIVLIISDDQAWTDYAFMGHPHVRTPQPRPAGAREPDVFARLRAVEPVLPQPGVDHHRLYPHQHKVTSNDPPLPAGMQPREFQRSAGVSRRARGHEPAPGGRADAAATARQAGYLSLQTGKWWQGDYRRGGFTHGMTQGERHGDAGTRHRPQDDAADLRFHRHSRARRAQPFFVWYAPMMPHEPHTPPERLLDQVSRRRPHRRTSPATGR